MFQPRVAVGVVCIGGPPPLVAVSLGDVLPREVERDHQHQRPGPRVHGIERQRFSVADPVGDEPDHEPDERHVATCGESYVSSAAFDHGKGEPVEQSFLVRRAFSRGTCEALCASPGPVARDLPRNGRARCRRDAGARADWGRRSAGWFPPPAERLRLSSRER
jgi:hypothetical protein